MLSKIKTSIGLYRKDIKRFKNGSEKEKKDILKQRFRTNFV